MALALIASTVAMASVDVYQFKSSMKCYNLKKQAYTTTAFNGTLTVNTEEGTAVLNATKKDTKETFELELVATTNETYAIVGGKKNSGGAVYAATFADEDGTLNIALAGAGSVKTKVTGCGPCGDKTVCSKITSISGTFIGNYECGCSNGQFYEYDGSCELPETKEATVSPVFGTWAAKLKSSN